MDKTNSLDEILDVVDENDEVVGQAPRKDVHTDRPLRHREVAIMVYDQDKRVLLHQRSKFKLQHPLEWSTSVAGHITSGLQPHAGARNELKEELGLELELTFVEKFYNEGFQNHKFQYWYVAEYTNQEIIVEKQEIEQIRFVSEYEFEDMIRNGEAINETTVKFLREFWKSGV